MNNQKVLDAEVMSSAVALASSLIACPSVTPDDAGCQTLIAQRLIPLGFKIENLRFGDVDNLWARKGKDGPLLVLAGHTDVVPTGPLEDWQSNPFTPTIVDGQLIGRGVSDMKAPIAAMVVAVEEFLIAHPDHKGSIAFLITSDEEAIAVNGTVKVVELLQSRNEKIDWCILGEPSCHKFVGDTIKNGARGSLIGDLVVHGIQGHIACPQLAANPIHLFSSLLTELCEKKWDNGNEYFEPTSFQISNINAGTGAENIIPGELKVKFNFRFSTELTADWLKSNFEEMLKKHGLKYDISWRLSGNPFLTPKGTLVNAIARAVKAVKGVDPKLSTAGGTSDGRFIAITGCEVVEFGLTNATMHKVNECAAVTDIDALSEMYKLTMENLLCSAG